MKNHPIVQGIIQRGKTHKYDYLRINILGKGETNSCVNSVQKKSRVKFKKKL